MGETKNLRLKRFGYQRIVKNSRKFGWTVTSIVEETETEEKRKIEVEVDENGDVHVNDTTTTNKTITMVIGMVREPNDFVNLNTIRLLECVYNIFYYIRSLIGWILPFFSGLIFIAALAGGGDAIFETSDSEWSVGVIWFLVLFAWLGLILLENILAGIAEKNLIRR